MRPDRRLPWLTLAVLALSLPASAREVLEPLPSVSDSYGESFSFMVDLEDGSFVSAQLSVTNLGPGSRHGICRATVVQPGRKPWTPQTRVGSKEWSYDAASRTLKVGPCSIREGTGTLIEVPLDNGLVRIDFSEPLAPQELPGSAIIVGNARYRHEVLLPFSPAKVSLVVPGNGATELSGGGYGDHSHSTVAPAKLARRWVRFRALRGDSHLLLLAREGLDGEFGPVYLWSEGDAPQVLQSFDLRRTDEGDAKRASWEAELSSEDGLLTLRSTSLLLRSAPVKDLGFLGSMVKPLVGSPVTYVMRAVLERPGQPAVPGVMEVSLDEG